MIAGLIIPPYLGLAQMLRPCLALAQMLPPSLALAQMLLPSPALAQTTPEKRAVMDKLLDALRTAPNEQVAGALEDKIRQSWFEASTPAVTLLMSRGVRTSNAGSNDEADAVFSDAIVLDPNLAEAWHQRAIARFRSGDSAGAVRDIQEALRLEPRHFDAWRTLERIAEAREDWKAAYDAWRHVLDIDPRTSNGEDRLKDLKRKAFGDNA
jgi:Flp pilus assembly protein TadD